MSEFRVDGKVALISGAARGLGAATAATLAAGGAKVVIGDLLDELGRATAATLGDAHYVHLDVTKEADWEAAVAATVKRFGGLDIVVNNAGVETTALLEDCTLEDFKFTQDVNVTGMFLGVKHAIRAMKPGGIAGRGGSIVNISSVAGLKGSFALGAYCASKGGARLLTKAAAIECAKLNYGIRVNSVHPGMVNTEMGAKVLKDFLKLGLVPDVTTAEAAFEAAHLLGRGRPQDIANGAFYLASDASKWITGTELVVDGGFAVA